MLCAVSLHSVTNYIQIERVSRGGHTCISEVHLFLTGPSIECVVRLSIFISQGVSVIIIIENLTLPLALSELGAVRHVGQAQGSSLVAEGGEMSQSSGTALHDGQSRGTDEM